MDRLNLDLRDFSATRADLERLALRQRAAEADVAAARNALAEAVRAGVSGDRSQLLRQRVAAAQAARDGLVAERGALQRRLDDLANRVIRERDPAEVVNVLDGHLPIALLPMRIETRYVGAQGQTTLRIRVYPDDLNTIDHEAAPTANEQESGKAYWIARFAHDEDEAARILRDLIRNFGRGRALWLVRILTPNNPVPAAGNDAAPDFPLVDVIDSLAKRTRAVLLPERWCAIGYVGEERVEVFRVWAKNTIPDELVLSPDWLATDDPEALLGGDRAWMVDFDAALEKGMAIEVTQADIKRPANVHFVAPFDLATGTLERLVVVGFDWTKTAAESGADFTDLLAAHRDSTGLGFAALGTPTNNTEAAPAGYSPTDQRLPPPPSGKSPEDQDALQLMQWAFGIDPKELPSDNIDNPHLCDQRTGLHMMNVLWRGTFGDYIMDMWNPSTDGYNGVLGPGELFALRQYATSYVRPSGPLPVLRVNKQPYGMLPLVGKRFADPRDSKVETAVGKVLGVLRPMWDQARKKVPLLADGDVDKAKDILQTAPWSQTAYYRDKENNACYKPNPFGDAQSSGRFAVVQGVISALGPYGVGSVHIGTCNDFLPDPPYSAGYLAGVPWVLSDAKDPTKEAADSAQLPDPNYLDTIAKATLQGTDGDSVLVANQQGPALLQALAAYSVQKEIHEAAGRFIDSSKAVNQVLSRATPTMPYVETVPENEAIFTVQTPKELMRVSVPEITGEPDARRARRLRVRHTCAAAGEQRGAASLRKTLRRLERTPRADSRSRGHQVEPRFPEAAPGGRAEHRVALDARRILVPPRRVDRGARQPPPRANARSPADGPVHRRLCVGREVEAGHPPGQRGVPARAIPGAGRDGRDPAQRIHGQPRARRVRHRARLEAHPPRPRHPARPHARPAARGAVWLPHRTRPTRQRARQVHLAAAPRLPVASRGR